MTVVVFIAFFGFNFVMPVLPLYVRELEGGDVSRAALLTGVMLAVSPLLAAFTAPLWGVVADRFGRKRMVQRSLLVIVAATTLMGLVSNVAQLFALRVAIGVFGGFTPMAMAYMVAVSPAASASAALGYLQAAQMGGLIAGPFFAGFVADQLGLRAAFFGGAAVMFVGLIALTALTQDDRVVRPPGRASSQGDTQGERDDVRARHRRGRTSGLRALATAARLPGFVTVMIVLFLVQFVDRSFGPILPLYVGELGTRADQVASYSGLIISLAAAGTALSAAALGHLAGRLPVRRLLAVTLAAGAALCLPLAAVQTSGQLLVTRLVLGLFAGGTLTLAYSLANEVAPLDAKGAAFGVLSSVALLGSAVSPLLTGALTSVDLRAVFVLDSALYVVALVWTLRGAKRSRHAAAGSLPALPHT
jgi:DHA1 family multidrug resistance protein-like MFS transporter